MTNVIKMSLNDLMKAIKGFIVMTEDLELMYESIVTQQIPIVWKKVSYPSLKPLASWIQDYHRRIEFMRNWLRKGPPLTFWLPGFFFPQVFFIL